MTKVVTFCVFLTVYIPTDVVPPLLLMRYSSCIPDNTRPYKMLISVYGNQFDCSMNHIYYACNWYLVCIVHAMFLVLSHSLYKRSTQLQIKLYTRPIFTTPDLPLNQH